MSSSYLDFNRNLVKDVREHGKPTSGPFLGRDVLILTTKGAKSGEVRSTPLVYTRDKEHHVIVASKGGAPTNPHSSCQAAPGSMAVVSLPRCTALRSSMARDS